MLSFVVFLTLILQTCSEPCTNLTKKDGYEKFCMRHLQKLAPTTTDKTLWQKFINKIGTWDRPKQSFFPYNAFRAVLSVCLKEGKVYKGNLCISKWPLFFFTVEVNSNRKKVKSVYRQQQHVILGCGKINGICLPIHFEENKEDIEPDNTKQDCNVSNTTLISLKELFHWL